LSLVGILLTNISLPEQPSLPEVSTYIPFMLSDSIFCGHLVTDLDSIAGAIGAAELYGGIPARASQVNSETQFALDYWGVSKPEPIEEMVVSLPGAGICLVDHQQMSQVNPAIDPERIVGVIDHHALQNSTIVTDRAIYIDIRPWGSMSTIIAHTFLSIQRRPRKSTAGMLLCAILSDTLNLMGPTTTDWDRMMVAILCEVAGVRDIESLAKAQFKAKSKELESQFLLLPILVISFVSSQVSLLNNFAMGT
jgi:manganese-dependent inorganic pyrophosphatase